MITLEEICLNLILGNNKIPTKPNDEEHEYCYGCVYDELNKLCPHYKPIKIWITNVKET